MNLYRISQTEADGYDTFDAAIVAAETEDRARKIHPYAEPKCNWQDGQGTDQWWSGVWCKSPDRVAVVKIGTADPGTPEGVILASFNAG